MRRVLLFVVLSACPKPAAPPVDAGAPRLAFWSWFAAEEPRLASALAADPEKVMDEIQQHLSAQEPGLIVELQVMPKPGRPHGLVISAGGDLKLFPKVKQLVSGAPTLGKFEVITFRPRHDPELELSIGGKKVGPSDFTFRETGRQAGKLDLEIAIEGLTPENHDELVRAAFLLLDATVGEYDAETKIGNIDFAPATDAGLAPHRPLAELAPLVDERK